MAYHKTLGALLEDFGTNQILPIEHPWGHRNQPHPTLRGSSPFTQNIFLQTFYQTPSVQTISMCVNRFSFLTLVLSSSIPSMTFYLPRTHIWHVFFHSFHYHLVIWGHLQIVSILFPRLIRLVTIWQLSDSVLLTLLNFKTNWS
jgi:hypothetical protein